MPPAGPHPRDLTRAPTYSYVRAPPGAASRQGAAVRACVRSEAGRRGTAWMARAVAAAPAAYHPPPVCPFPVERGRCSTYRGCKPASKCVVSFSFLPPRVSRPADAPAARRRSWSTVFPSTVVFGRPRRAAVSLVDLLVPACVKADASGPPCRARSGDRKPATASFAFVVQKPWTGTKRAADGINPGVLESPASVLWCSRINPVMLCLDSSLRRSY